MNSKNIDRLLFIVLANVSLLAIAFGCTISAVLAECSSPDGPEAVVASYDGGQVKVSDICKCLADKDFMAFVESTSQTPAKEVEDIARKLSAQRILVKYAEDNKLDKSPEYLLDAKFKELLVLASLVIDELKASSSKLTVTEEQIYDYYTANKQKFKPDLQFEDVHDDINMQIRYEHWKAQLDELRAKAQAQFPILCEAEVTSKAEGSDDSKPREKPILQCGKFNLTTEDLSILTQDTGAPLQKCPDIREYLKRGSMDQNIPIAEWARTQKYDKKPEFASRLKLELDKALAEIAKQSLIAKWLSETKFTEARLKQAYDKDWTATVDPVLEYDAVMVPLGVSGDVTDAERQVKQNVAESSARKIIASIQKGMSIEDALTKNQGISMLSAQRRVVMEDDPLYTMVAGVPAGKIAAEPVYDMGAMCIIRVRKFEPRKKTPYDMAKRYVEESLKRQVEQSMRDNFEEQLLMRSGFRLDSGAAERITR